MSVYDRLKPKLPHLPGCYLMKDRDGIIIYVGKAKDLKKRVSSYFLGRGISAKTRSLVSKIVEVELLVTDNEVEALILENNLIKQHQPKYNIDLKANVRYAYICLTDEEYPRVMTVRKKGRGVIYGPYTDGYLRVQLIKLCIDICKLRVCTVMPKRACLQYHIGKCDAPCISNISKEAYLANVKRARKLLEGKTDEIEQELEREMKVFAASREFEKAAERRNQLVVLRSVVDQQKVETQRRFDQDVFATLQVDDILKVEVFMIKRGVIAKREKYSVSLLSGQSFSDFLRAYYSIRPIPKEIIIDQDLEDQVALEGYFSKLAAKSIDITNPKQGEKKQLLDMARTNARIDFQDEYPELAELSRVLKLQSIPTVIECFDISHLGAQDVVAASVQYKNGMPNPPEFRKYEIRTVSGQDDFRSMYEAVFRRYKRLSEEGQILPDLVVIDGGKQQLAFARKALFDAGVKLPIIALAKKEEEIYLPYLSVPLRLPRSSSALKLLQRIRDSTHRFVLSYQKQKRSKRMVSE